MKRFKMAKKGMVVIVLLFGIVIIGCSNSTNSDINFLDTLNLSTANPSPADALDLLFGETNRGSLSDGVYYADGNDYGLIFLSSSLSENGYYWAAGTMIVNIW